MAATAWRSSSRKHDRGRDCPPGPTPEGFSSHITECRHSPVRAGRGTPANPATARPAQLSHNEVLHG